MKLGRLAELELIAAIRKEFAGRTSGLRLGIGDDAAVIKTGGVNLILTKDLLVEGAHFERAFHPAFLLGRKSLNVNISDVAAMGGTPRFALLGLGLPPATPTRWVEDFFSGIKSAAGEFRVSLAGGDLSRSSRILISVTVIGQGKTIIRRTGGRPGDLVFVSGYLGDAAAGLALLKRGTRPARNSRANSLVKAFLDPEPQVRLGLELSQRKVASAMLDMSDGLSVDIHNLCRASACGAEVWADKLPLSPALRALMKNPLDFGLRGGEDYGLLFSVPAGKLPEIKKIQKRSRLTQIGRLIPGSRVCLVSQGERKSLFVPRGFRHFD